MHINQKHINSRVDRVGVKYQFSNGNSTPTSTVNKLVSAVADGLCDAKPRTGQLSLRWQTGRFDTRDVARETCEVYAIGATNSWLSSSLLIYWQHSARLAAVTKFCKSIILFKVPQRSILIFGVTQISLKHSVGSVSYTHLTLPTNREV